MPTAPDLDTILDFETQIELALQTRLQQVGIGQVDVKRSKLFVVSGRVDVGLTMGAATSRRHIPADLPDGPINSRYFFESAWNATITFDVITEREENGQLHAAYRAKVRRLMLRFFTEFPEDLLPYHAIEMASTAGSSPGLVSSQNEDVTQLRYSCVIAVREDAWPAPY